MAEDDLQREVSDVIVAQQVRYAVGRLSEDERQAMELAYWGGPLTGRWPNAQPARGHRREPDEVVLAPAVMTPDGTVFVWGDGLPSVAATGPINSGRSWGVAALAITEEPAGGVTATDKQPVVTGLLQQS